jgi:hypothetical protein
VAGKIFTPKDANKTLPLVRRITADVLERGRELADLNRSVEDRDDLSVEKADRLHVLEAELQELFSELEAIGCSYRDWSFDKGLVDFPAEIDGERVLLCWRSDEPEVRYYHSPEAGYAGRQPIPSRLLEGKTA